MLALLSMASDGGESGRLIVKRGGVEAYAITVFGAPALHIKLRVEQNSRALGRRIARARKILLRLSAERVCFSDGFPYADSFRDFPEINLMPLGGLMARHIAALLSQGRETACLFAHSFSTEAYGALAAMCECYRYVMADIPETGVRQLFDIQKKLGISVIVGPAPGQLQTVQAAVFMDIGHRPAVLPGECVVYAADKAALSGVFAGRYVSDIMIGLPPEREKQLPRGFPRNRLISDALFGMRLGAEELSLRDITISDNVCIDKDLSFDYNQRLIGKAVCPERPDLA